MIPIGMIIKIDIPAIARKKCIRAVDADASQGDTMISDAEFVAIRNFDRTLAHSTSEGQRLVNRKNADIAKLQAVIAELTRQLVAERGARKLAEFKLARRH